MKRILFVHFHDLYSSTGGAKRALQNLKGCLRYGRCDTYQTGRSAPAPSPALRFCMFITAEECAELAKLISSVGYDTVFFDTSLYGDAVSYLKARCPGMTAVVHCHNFEKQYFRDAEPDGSTLPAFAETCERNAVTAADCLVFISKEDRQNICREYGLPDGRHFVIPPSLSDAYDPAAAAPAGEPYVLFLGSAFFANLESARFLIREIAPHSKRKLVIAGKGMDCLSDEASENTEILGYVPSLASLMNGAYAFVSPVFSGSGSKLKIAEALMHGKYLIASPPSLCGYDAERMAVSVCETAEDFLAAIDRLDAKKTFYSENRALYLENHETEAACRQYRFLAVND